MRRVIELSEEDFVKGVEVETSVLDRTFSFREMLGEDRGKLTEASIKRNVEEDTVTVNIVGRNNFYLSLVTKAPYVEWNNLKTVSARVNFLNHLKESIRMGLIKNIRSYGKEGDAEKK